MSPLRRVLRPVAALSLAVVLAACSSSEPEGRSGDVMFAQMMIPHHEQAVEMADLALEKDGVSAEVQDLATDIKAAQDPEIKTMSGWLGEWGASATASGNGMNHGGGNDAGAGMMSDDDMQSLRAAEGAEFDKQWLTMMIEHHEGAVDMAKDVLKTTQDPEVRALAEAVVSGQEAEISTMQGLLD